MMYSSYYRMYIGNESGPILHIDLACFSVRTMRDGHRCLAGEYRTSLIKENGRMLPRRGETDGRLGDGRWCV